MRISLLGSAGSIHIARLANAFVTRGHAVQVISLHPVGHAFLDDVNICVIPRSRLVNYLTAGRHVRRALRSFKPDIVNAHYASGYGLLASMVRFRPTLLSVWGSDVYQFPYRSILHKAVLSHNLRAATAIGSTSHCMARQTALFCDTKPMFVTPFGVDTNVFCPDFAANGDAVVVGTVKGLNAVYGVDVLIRAFRWAWDAAGKPSNMRLEITGDGSERNNLIELATELGINDLVKFHGRTAHHQVPAMLNRLDIFVALSHSESFGVAALEAAACGLPVVVSNAEGFVEIVHDGEYGFVVPKADPVQAGQAVLKLLEDADLRRKMGQAGRAHVVAHYAWNRAIDTFLDALDRTIKESENG